MALLCRKLRIQQTASNTCLPKHIIISPIPNKLIDVDSIVKNHSRFTKHLLSSNHLREDAPTVNAMLKRFKLSQKVCIRRIISSSVGGFVLINDFFGTDGKLPISSIRRHNHFFLGIQRKNKKIQLKVKETKEKNT